MTAIKSSPASIPVAQRANRFTYAIRNIVAEAQRVEAAGTNVRYLNIGDPVAFGFNTPAHMIEAVERSMRDGHNGYGPSAGIAPAREAVAAEYTTRGFPVSADRVFMTAGTSEGIEFALTAIVEEGGEALMPLPTYPLFTAVLAKIGARARYYRLDPARDWMPDLDHLNSLVTPATRALVVIDPNNPTGACCSTATRRALLAFAERHGLPILADEVYGDLAYGGSLPPIGSLEPDAPIISFAGLSKGYLVPGWRAGWMAIGRSPRLDDVSGSSQKAGGWPAVQYGADAVRGGGGPHRRSLASGLVSGGAEGARLDHVREAVGDSRGHLRRAQCRILRDAEDRAAPRPDRSGLRPRAAARDRRPLRVRVRLRSAARRRVPAHRLPRPARRASGRLPPDGGLHA